MHHLPNKNESGFRNTVRGGLGKLQGGRNFSPLAPPAAQHGTFDSANVDRLGLGGEGIPDATSERFGRAHSRPEVLGSRVGPVRDGSLDLHLNLDTNLETINQTRTPDEHTRGPNRVGYDSEGGLKRHSRYEADFGSLNLDTDHGRRTHENQGKHSRLPGTRGARTSSRFESWREIQDLTREEWLRRGTLKPRPDYRLPYKACWVCGVRGHKRGSPEFRQPNVVVCFGCGEPGRTKATCPTCSELWESDEVLAGRRKARPGQYLVRRPEIVAVHQKAIHDAGWCHGTSGRKAEDEDTEEDPPPPFCCSSEP